MDSSENEKLETGKSGNQLNYQTSNISCEWQFGSANLANPPTSLVLANSSIVNPSMGSSMLLGDSFCPTIWDRRAGAFLQSAGVAILPQSLSQFPTDSPFIERATRFSCFNGGSFSDMVMDPFGTSEPLDPYGKGGGIQVPEVVSANGLKAASVSRSHHKSCMAKAAANDSPAVDHGVSEGSPINGEREMGSNLRPFDEGICGIRVSSNDSETEFSGGGQDELTTLDNATGEASAKGLAANKRKRSSEHLELDQVAEQLSIKATKESTETTVKGEQNPNSTVTRSNGREGKESSQNSGAPKEDYIHVRARRGQATNSHSLAERVRREKISERMKFLQDLVPGCSKVTGKAVMLDEIINYVQSLQRQVEFLSMKLAAVNPQLDLNIEGLLVKDIHQARGVQSTIGFSPDMGMSYPQLHPSQQGLIQAGIPGIGSPSDMLRRTINSQLTTMNGYKDLTQVSNAWDDGFQNAMQMSFSMNTPSNTQEQNDPLLPSSHKKVER